MVPASRRCLHDSCDAALVAVTILRIHVLLSAAGYWNVAARFTSFPMSFSPGSAGVPGWMH